MAIVFLSYNTFDTSYLKILKEKLSEANIDIWEDNEGIKPGSNLRIEIEKGVRKSKYFLFCIGENGIGRWQKEEFEIAYYQKVNNKIVIIPIVLPNGGKEFDSNKTPKILKVINFVNFNSGLNDKKEWIRFLNLLRIKPKHQVKENTSADFLRKAASVALFNNNRILLLRRNEKNKNGIGQWQLPGGKIGRENELTAIQREVKEEVGINIPKNNFKYLTVVKDVWLDKSSGISLQMSLYTCEIDSVEILLENEFDEFIWIDINEISNRKDIILFGINNRLVKIIRRYKNITLPLREISEHLESNYIIYPVLISSLPINSSYVLLDMLSMFGIIDDNSGFIASSNLSASILNIFSIWALSEQKIFENTVTDISFNKKSNELNPKIFESHHAIVDLFSKRLGIPISQRSVCDTLLLIEDELVGKTFLLMRWDFRANKFQIPAKGLELLEGDKREMPAKFVVSQRFGHECVSMFRYQHLGNFSTVHQSAGSLMDGTLIRDYHISLFGLILIKQHFEKFINKVEGINSEAVKVLNSKKTLSTDKHPSIYFWVELDMLKKNPTELFNHQIQGFNEILNSLGFDIFNRIKQFSAIDISKTRIQILDNISSKFLKSLNKKEKPSR